MNRKSTSKKIEEFVNERILSDNLEEIFGERFGRYSKYIIQDRAIPDVRDGLKPVQRRILFAMYRLGIFYNKPYKKSARIVGEVIGKYHPHGDVSVYDALVRMSQDFKIRFPLIDMQGNNGSIDGDGPAAMRYTEARLSKFSDYLLKDINKKTVGFVPNFDDEEYEPVVLPSAFPNLLVNGATGISAGYATEIPPHNIDEIINATIYRINNPNCKLKEIMRIVQGPDFPTGGIVQGIDGLKSAYETGRGKIVVKSKTEIVTGDKFNQLIITEIPYEVNKSQLIKKMTDSIEQKNIDGVLDIRDESDKDGLSIIVDIRKDTNPEFIRNFFFKNTDLQINYNFNVVAICNKRPMQLGLLALLDAYIAHQKEVLTNRCNFELTSAKRRLHIVEGLISMTSILDAVIQTIRNSNNKRDAKDNLITMFGFTEIQAEAIVMLQLYRLTNTDIVALNQEQESLSEKIKELEEILSNEESLLNLIKKELLITLEELSTPRKTIVEHEIDEVNVYEKVMIPKEDVVILITKDGYIKRMYPKNYDNGEETKIKENDIILARYNCTTIDTLLLFSQEGNYVYLPVSNIPDCKHKDLGRNLSTLVNIASDEQIIFGVPIDDFSKERYLLFTTKSGLTKRTLIKELEATRFGKALKATKLRDGDKVVSVDICDGEGYDVIMTTRDGFITRYPSKEISLFAPASFGVKALEMKNRPNDEVVGGYYVSDKDVLVVLTSKGVIKRYKPSEIIKGHKTHVGKQYIATSKSTKTYVVDSKIVHGTNIANDFVNSYVLGSDGLMSVDLGLVKNSKSKTTAQSIVIGKLEKLLLETNNNDFNSK